MSKEPTAIGDALAALGLNRSEYEFAAAISKLWNSGVTAERGRVIYETLAERMPGKGQEDFASDGQKLDAKPRQPMPDISQSNRASDGHRSDADSPAPIEDDGANEHKPLGHGPDAPSSSPARGGEGQSAHAQDRRIGVALPAATPAREPSPTYLKAAGDSRRETARSILYRYKTSTGAWWGDVHPYEVSGMTRDSIRGLAIMSTLGPLNSKQMNMTFDQLLTPEQAQIAMEKADKELANVAQ
jgi:hypothetical protein